MHLSYWEQASFFGNPHTVVIGGGITGLNAALHTKRLHPDRDVLVLERGRFPAGASTRNAGFACFGSAGEMVADLKVLSDAEIIHLLRLRWEGLQLLRKTCGDAHLGYEPTGSLEVFKDEASFARVAEHLDHLNALTKEAMGAAVFELVHAPFAHTTSFPYAIRNVAEGALHTGAMMARLAVLAQAAGVRVVTKAEVLEVSTRNVRLADITLHPSQILVATNGFARTLLPELEVQPVRNQVWITHPIDHLPIQGTFHADEGYIYFRNVEDRLLIGGFRNEFPDSETTHSFGMHGPLEERIKSFVANHVLPKTPHTWDCGWSGILGVGSTKTPILQEVQPGIHAAVRLGGMGVAIGSQLGKALAEQAD